MTDRQAIRDEATHLAECMTDGGWEGREMEKLARQVLALLDELKLIEEALKRLPAAIRDAERFDAQHGLHIPGDSALAVVLGGIEETAMRLTEPAEYERIMSGRS